MDDIENLIYLLFVLISLISGVWKNAQKQKKEKQRKATAAPIPREEVLEDDALPWEREEFQERVMEERNEVVLDRLAQLEKAAIDAKKNRRLKRRNLLQEQEASLEESVAEENPLATYTKDFDAKKAIIYSEILNPPYL